jgi:hypothetical protein
MGLMTFAVIMSIEDLGAIFGCANWNVLQNVICQYISKWSVVHGHF